MSGRVHVTLPDGRRVVGFRKTLARRSPRRHPLERLHDTNARCARRFPTTWARDVRLGFLLPPFLQPFVASGPHGHSINIIKGFVQVRHGSFEECCVSAEHFFVDVAKGKPAFTVLASVISNQAPGAHYGRYLSVVNGAMVVCGGAVEPRIYEG